MTDHPHRRRSDRHPRPRDGAGDRVTYLHWEPGDQPGFGQASAGTERIRPEPIPLSVGLVLAVFVLGALAGVATTASHRDWPTLMWVLASLAWCGAYILERLRR